MEFNSEIQKKFRDDHIVYRASCLRAGIAFFEGKYEHSDNSVGNACFVACSVTVRIFMEFFGIGINKKSKPPQLRYKTKNEIIDTDVTSKLFIDKRLTLDEIKNDKMHDVLLDAYLTGERAAAHFTHYPSKGEFGGNAHSVITAAKYLLIKLDELIYLPKNEKLPEKWNPSGN